MSDELKFLNLCRVMANLEDFITTFEKIGLNLEADEGIGYCIYDSCSTIYKVAIEYLDLPNIEIEDKVFNDLLQANGETVDKVSKEVWNLYGIK